MAEVTFHFSFREKREGQSPGVPWNVLADDLDESFNLSKPQFPPKMKILSQKKCPEDARQVSTHSRDDGIAGGLNEVILIKNIVQRLAWSIHASRPSCGLLEEVGLRQLAPGKNHK